MMLQRLFSIALLCALGFFSLCHAEDAAKIRVLIWDEQQPAQKQVYANFLGNEIARYLKTLPGLEVSTAALTDAEQGLSKAALDNADVLIWWGHIRNREVTAETGKDIVARIQSGKLSMISLHSAHWSAPFVQAMRARAIEDATAKVPEADRNSVKLKLVEPKAFSVPKRTDPLTPSSELKQDADGSKVLEVHLPNCVFPAYRADGQPGHMKTLLPDHPIAKDIPSTWDVPHTEMYDEPFHVPAPDQVVFEEHWEKGEHFRSGCVWSIGKGKVFYFRPGHETYGVYKEALPLKVISNAVYWLAGKELPR